MRKSEAVLSRLGRRTCAEPRVTWLSGLKLLTPLYFAG